MTLESNKYLGGIGALLMFLGIFPYIDTFGIVEIIGAIMILVALHGLANIFSERGIFSNAIYGIITGIVGAIVAAGIAIAIVLPNLSTFLMKIYPSWNGSWSSISSLSGMTPNTSNISFSDIAPFIAAAIVVFIVVWIVSIVAAYFFRRSFKQLSTKSSVGLFSTAGLLLLIGAVLIIIVGLGLILMWIAILLLAIAFFQLKPQMGQPQMTAAAYSAPPGPTPV